NQQGMSSELKALVMQNCLYAFELSTGKIKWRWGVPLSELGKRDPNDPFADSHFLGVPISVGGKLYVLNEKNNGQAQGDSELRLVCLDPNTGNVLGPIQSIGNVLQQHRFTHDASRRLNAVHLAYGEGILVCPTNAGEILGVDLMSRTLAWAFPYREKPPNPAAFPKQFENQPQGAIALSYANWKVSPPVIVDGKVVFTAPDSSAVHCINLRDGTEVWSAPQNDSDVFLAGVFGEKVVIVGKNSVRALQLKDGAAIWNHLLTGDLPSGQGVASNNVYYLPLRKGEICAIDLERWQVKAHNRAGKPGADPPGNLVFYEGAVLSQTPTKVVAYAQLATKLTEAEVAFKADPTV